MSDLLFCTRNGNRVGRRVVLRDVKHHQKRSPLEAADAVRDLSTGSGLPARIPRRTKERAAMIKCLKEMLLLNAVLLPWAASFQRKRRRLHEPNHRRQARLS